MTYNIAIILAGGRGSRFGSELPKQYQVIFDRTVIDYVACEVSSARNVDEIVFVGDRSIPQLDETVTKYGAQCVPGGETRNLSLFNGLAFIAQNRPECTGVMIFDAVRPMITAKLVERYFDLIGEGYGAVSTTQRITDSLGCVDTWQVDRSRYYLMQSPEAFDFPLLWERFDKNCPLTEVIQQLPEGTKVYLNFDFTDNIKLTYGWEMDYLIAAIRKKEDWA